MASFPKPYLNTVPTQDGNDPMIKHVPFDTLDIASRSSGLPKGGVNSGEMSLEHVGGSKDSR